MDSSKVSHFGVQDCDAYFQHMLLRDRNPISLTCSCHECLCVDLKCLHFETFNLTAHGANCKMSWQMTGLSLFMAF